MATTNINRVVLTGNLTRDPELRSTTSGVSVCGMRIASNTRRKDASGAWQDKPNYFDTTVFGAQAESCARFLVKGRAVAVDGRLEWREWETDDGAKRQAVEVVSDTVQFLGAPDAAGSNQAEPAATATAAVPALANSNSIAGSLASREALLREPVVTQAHRARPLPRCRDDRLRPRGRCMLHWPDITNRRPPLACVTAAGARAAGSRFRGAMPDDVTITHGAVEVEAGVRLHWAEAGEGDDLVLLVHGFPQTWWSWRAVIAQLAAAGYRAIAPDLRGAGSSSKPAGGYDTWTLAGDLHELVRGRLAPGARLSVVGHDIGSMVALAYALRFRDDPGRLVLMEGTLPGTDVYERLKNDPRHWHFAFHQALDVPEALTAGRERTYLKLFFDGAAYDPEAIGTDDLERYARAFEQPGAMRAGFELYRAFEADARTNREALAAGGRLRLPVLAVAGAANLFADVQEAMLADVAVDARCVVVPRAGHWLPEENPEGLLDVLLPFLTEV